MNLIVLKGDGSWYTRPDSTLCRVQEDFYLPEGFCEVEVHSCRYIKLLRAGKAILPKFAERYFAPLCTGYLFYGIDSEGKRNPYIDRTTILKEAEKTCSPDESSISAICSVSSIMTFRRGDYVILEDSASTVLRPGDSMGSMEIK